MGKVTIEMACSINGLKGNYFENKLKLEKIIKEKDDIVQVHYSIVK